MSSIDKPNTLKLSLVIEMEKKIVVPQLTRIDDGTTNMVCIVDDKTINMNCSDITCADCIYNINNIDMLTKSRKIQSL